MGRYFVGLNYYQIQHAMKKGVFDGYILVKKLPYGVKNDKVLVTLEELVNIDLDYNAPDEDGVFINYFEHMINYVLSKDKNAQFMLYNQGILYNRVLPNVMCMNDINLVHQLNIKPLMRQLLEDVVNLLPYEYLKGKDISFDKIVELFHDDQARYVVQEAFGFAGIGTHLVSKDTIANILPLPNQDEEYSISKYVEKNIPINVTFMIGDESIIVFDGSKQDIVFDKQLLYNGSDYEAFKLLDHKYQAAAYGQTYAIAQKLQSLGYRGIGGVDYIIANDQVYFMETNPRFQSSSADLDEILLLRGYPDIYELNYMSFNDTEKFNVVSASLMEDKLSAIQSYSPQAAEQKRPDEKRAEALFGANEGI